MISQNWFHCVIGYCKDRPKSEWASNTRHTVREQNRGKVKHGYFSFALLGLWSFCSQKKSICSFSLQYLCISSNMYGEETSLSARGCWVIKKNNNKKTQKTTDSAVEIFEERFTRSLSLNLLMYGAFLLLYYNLVIQSSICTNQAQERSPNLL